MTYALPNPALTPGVVDPHVTLHDMMQPGFAASVRNVSFATKLRVCARYHAMWWPGRWEIDHLVPLSLGGENVITNLWPQPHAEAVVKDRIELETLRAVRAGTLALAAAQKAFQADWTKLGGTS